MAWPSPVADLCRQIRDPKRSGPLCLALFKRGYDTFDIAILTNSSEAFVYKKIHRERLSKQGVAA